MDIIYSTDPVILASLVPTLFFTIVSFTTCLFALFPSKSGNKELSNKISNCRNLYNILSVMKKDIPLPNQNQQIVINFLELDIREKFDDLLICKLSKYEELLSVAINTLKNN